MKSKLQWVTIVLLLICVQSSSIFADEASSLPYYLDLSLGTANPKLSLGEVGATVDKSDFSDDGYYRLVAGYIISASSTTELGIEMFYANYGSSEGDLTSATESFTLAEQVVTPTQTFEHTVEVQSIGLGLNISERVRSDILFNIRTGLHYWDSQTTTSIRQVALGIENDQLTLLTANIQEIKDSNTGSNPYVGIGLGYAITKRVSLSVEYMRYKFEALDDTGYYKAYALSVGVKLD